ncbi:myosin-11 [Ixodes scapularis]|uniref:myosin-11 n=1 Tax=Ixodes scapularis TaxID=6945 RepID=UPI001A9D15D5|nr:myosin-11 [Ixodes scapularis]
MGDLIRRKESQFAANAAPARFSSFESGAQATCNEAIDIRVNESRSITNKMLKAVRNNAIAMEIDLQYKNAEITQHERCVEESTARETRLLMDNYRLERQCTSYEEQLEVTRAIVLRLYEKTSVARERHGELRKSLATCYAGKDSLLEEMHLAFEDGDRIAAAVAKLGKAFEASVNRLNSQRITMKERQEELTAAMESKQKELETMTGLCEDLKQQLSLPDIRVAELQSQLDSITSEKTNVERIMQLAEEELKLLQREKDDAEREVRKAQEEKEMLANFLETVAEHFSTLCDFSTRPDASVVELVDAGIHELSEECLQSKSRADQAEDSVRALEANKEALSAENQALMEKLQNHEVVLLESEQLRLQLVNAENTLSQTKNEIETSKQSACDALLQLQALLQDLAGDTSVSSADFNGAFLGIEGDILRRKEQSMRHLETVHQLKDVFKSLHDERDELAAQVHQMACDKETKEHALADLKADITGLYGAISNYEEELAEAHAEVESMRAAADLEEHSVEEKEKMVLLLLEREDTLKQLQQKLQETQSSLDEMRENTTALQQELETLRAKELMANDEREKMADMLVEKNDAISHLEDKIKASEAELAELKVEKLATLEITSALRAQNEELSKLAAEVNEKLKQEMELRDVPKNTIQVEERETQTTEDTGGADSKVQLEEALKQLDQVNSEHKRCKSEYECLTRECAEQLEKLEQSYLDKKKELEKAMSEKKDQVKLHDEAAKANKVMKAESEALKKKFDALETQIKKIQVAAAKKESAVEAENARLKDRLKELQKKVEELNFDLRHTRDVEANKRSQMDKLYKEAQNEIKLLNKTLADAAIAKMAQTAPFTRSKAPSTPTTGVLRLEPAPEPVSKPPVSGHPDGSWSNDSLEGIVNQIVNKEASDNLTSDKSFHVVVVPAKSDTTSLDGGKTMASGIMQAMSVTVSAVSTFASDKSEINQHNG